MRVSICMATYNRDPVILRQVFESIFSQSPPFEFEVIVCDDGTHHKDGRPNDVVRRLCKEYPIQYHRINRPPGFKNPCIPRNVTYRAATGDIIIAQSDEVVHKTPDAIEKLSWELKQYPGFFVIATVYACGPNGKPWSEYSGPGRKVPWFFLGALWRRDLYAVGGNCEDFAHGPGFDDEWFARCLQEGLGLQAYHTSAVVGHHLYHSPSCTKALVKPNQTIGHQKTKDAKQSGVWCASGGPWPCDSSGPAQTEQAFTAAYVQKLWGNNPSASGQGSSIEATESIRKALPSLVDVYGIESILDIPCGDFHWMQHVRIPRGIRYTGADVVRLLIENNTQQYARFDREFRHLDLVTSDLPEVDLLICRDCLGHLSLDDAKNAIRNIKRSKSKYLLTTTFWNHPENRNIKTGPGWATRCLVRSPFNFPPPRVVIDELCQESAPHFQDKSLALWDIDKL